jgi:nicotinamidase-related amidase
MRACSSRAAAARISSTTRDVVIKKGLAAFQHTHLDRLLSNLGVDQCVLCGPVPQSLSGTARIGALLGYTIFIATDAVHPTRSPYLDTLNNRAEFVSTRDVVAAAEDPTPAHRPEAPDYAMVVVDMQNDFVHPGSVKRRLGYSDAMEDEKRERLIANNREIAAAMRARGWPVVFVGVGRRPDLLDDARSRTVAAARPIPPEARYLEPDTWGSEFVEGLRPEPGDLVVQKKGNSGFGFTPLHRILRNIGVRRCLVTGGSSSGCVSDTFREGQGLGYEMTVISDATYPVGSTNISELGELGEIRTTEEVLAELRVPARVG